MRGKTIVVGASGSLFSSKGARCSHYFNRAELMWLSTRIRAQALRPYYLDNENRIRYHHLLVVLNHLLPKGLRNFVNSPILLSGNEIIMNQS